MIHKDSQVNFFLDKKFNKSLKGFYVFLSPQHSSKKLLKILFFLPPFSFNILPNLFPNILTWDLAGDYAVDLAGDSVGDLEGVLEVSLEGD